MDDELVVTLRVRMRGQLKQRYEEYLKTSEAHATAADEELLHGLRFDLIEFAEQFLGSRIDVDNELTVEIVKDC